jgi:hypothetical protein
MAAPKSNQFWNLRLKHGRNHAIETHEQLEQNFEEYCNWIENNPLIEIDYRGKDATMVELPKMRAMTKDSFALACGLSSWRVIDSWKERSEGFLLVITRIENIIYNQKFVGAAAGFLNANIIARDLGLADKKDLEITGEPFMIVRSETDGKTNS